MATDKVKKLEKKLKTLDKRSPKGATGRRKVDILNKLANAVFLMNIDKSEKYAIKARDIAKKIEYKKGLASSYNAISRANMQRSQYNAVLKWSSMALKLSNEINDKRLIADAHNDIGRAHNYLGDFTKALEHGFKALKFRENLNDQKGIAFSITNIACAYGGQGEHTKALKYFQKAQKIFRNIHDKYNTAKTFSYMGQMYLRIGDFDCALDSCFNATNLIKHTADKRLIGECYGNLGIVYETLSDYTKALESYICALDMFEQVPNDQGAAYTLGNMGNVYYELEEYSDAIKTYRKASKIFEKIGDRHGAMGMYTNIAMILRTLKKYDLAMQYENKALKICEDIGDNYGIGFIYQGIGCTYEAMGRNKKALEFYGKASKKREEIGDKEGLAESNASMANIFIILRQYPTASKYLINGLKLARTVGSKREQKKCYEIFIELCKAQKKYKQALIYTEKLYGIEREVFNTEKSKQINDMKIRYETEKKEKEAEISHLKNIKLRKEIKERKRMENELKKHRDQLEDTIDKRTAELKRELTKRRRVEKELLKHQNQLRALNRALSIVEEKQRRRTANYLHDHISQALSLTILKIRELQENSSAKDIKKALAEIKNMVAQTNQRTRSLTFEISPPILYELGLEPAVEWLVGQYQKQHGISYTFKDDGSSKPLKDDARILLFQAVRELLNNAAKHAQAQNVRISTCKDNNSIRIAVEDDGIGFNPEDMGLKITHNEGFGLFNIRERLHCLGGKIEIDSNKGKGTSVVLMVPLKRTRKKTKRKRR